MTTVLEVTYSGGRPLICCPDCCGERVVPCIDVDGSPVALPCRYCDGSGEVKLAEWREYHEIGDAK